MSVLRVCDASGDSTGQMFDFFEMQKMPEIDYDAGRGVLRNLRLLRQKMSGQQ